jgi:hypothetical protein
MGRRRYNNPSVRSKAAPGVAGAGSGTLFLLLARTLPDRYETWKQVAIYLAPTVSVAMAAALIWLREFLRDMLNERLKNRMFDQAQRKLEEIRNNQHTSQQEKERITDKLAELQKLRTDMVLEVIERDK